MFTYYWISIILRWWVKSAGQILPSSNYPLWFKLCSTVEVNLCKLHLLQPQDSKSGLYLKLQNKTYVVLSIFWEYEPYIRFLQHNISLVVGSFMFFNTEAHINKTCVSFLKTPDKLVSALALVLFDGSLLICSCLRDKVSYKVWTAFKLFGCVKDFLVRKTYDVIISRRT